MLTQSMHGNANFSKMFRARSLRFVLPMRKPSPDTPPEHNFITIEKVYQSIEMFRDGKSFDYKPNCDIDDNTNDIEYDSKTKFWRDMHKSFLRKKPAAHRLLDGKIFVKPELLCDVGCETPRINTEYHLGKEYRYFYAISCDLDLNNPGMVSLIRDCECPCYII